MKSIKAKDLFCSSACKISRSRRWCLFGLILILFWLNPLFVFWAAETENAAQPTTLPVEAASDSAIEKRLRAVIDNIDDFQKVKIDVNDGVVRLSGTTLRKESTERVAQMVSRFEGVIYVDNQIQVETDVETRVIPALTRIKQYLTTAVQKLPLIGVALAVIIAFWMISRFVTYWDLLFKRLGLNRLLRNLVRQFFGWIDQRKADFAKVRGEAIRRVKLALDDAGISMPEPIQTIRLEKDRSTRPETTSTPGLSAQGLEERETKTVDVSPDTQLEDQIKEDLSATHEPNLLTES